MTRPPAIPRSPRSPRRGGFTLLEVMIALGILAVSLMVLVDTQGLSVLMTAEATKYETATDLADEKMREVMLTLEREGWTSQDVEEEGDFTEFGGEEFRGDGLHLELEDEYGDFKWAYTVRRLEIDLPTNLGDVAGQLGDADYGAFGTAADEGMDAGLGGFDLSMVGLTPDALGEYLSYYVREVRVRVWWGDNEDETDQVELVHHVINPSGAVTETDDGGGTE